MITYLVRLEFGDETAVGDALEAMLASGFHSSPLFEVSAAETTPSRTRPAGLRLTMPARDVWSATLQVMALVHQSGYDPTAIEITTIRRRRAELRPRSRQQPPR